MKLFFITILAAICSAYLLFKLYNLLQALILKKMDVKLEDLKSYEMTPKVKQVNQMIETLVVMAILYKVFFT